MEACITVMKSEGAEIIDPVKIETEGKFDEGEMEVLLYEFKADLTAYLAALGPQARVHSLKDVIDFNEAHRQAVMPYFGQERMLLAQEKGPLTDEAYLKALESNHRLAGKEGIDAALAAQRLDALVAPTGGPAWLTDWINGDHYGGGCSSPAAVAGYPEPHCACRLHLWTAGWHLLHRGSFSRSDPDSPGLRLRAGYARAPCAPVLEHGGFLELKKPGWILRAVKRLVHKDQKRTPLSRGVLSMFVETCATLYSRSKASWWRSLNRLRRERCRILTRFRPTSPCLCCGLHRMASDGRWRRNRNP